MTVNNKISKWRASVIRWAPLLLWIGVIFFFSSPEGSFNQTSRIIGPLLHFFFPDITAETQNLVHFYVRKAAHLTEYLILGILACRAFLSWRYWPVLAFLLAVAVACADEFNQSFIATRTSSPYDVLLDVSGGVIGIAVVMWVNYKASIVILSE